MMREYGKMAPQFWMGTTGKALRGHMEAQIVAAYLISSPHANMLGLFYQPLPYIAHETGLTIEGTSKGLQRCIEAGFCAYDEPSEMVWVFTMAGYQIGEDLKETDKRCKGVQSEYDRLPENPFLEPFFERYGEVFHMACKRDSARAIEAPSKDLRSQEQEQEQEKEQETTPLPPKGGRKRREPKPEPVDSLGQPIPVEFVEAVGRIVDACPGEDRDGRKIRVTRGDVLTRLMEIRKNHPAVTLEILVQAWLDYLASQPAHIKAPQYFFGKAEDQGPNAANWMPYARAVYVRMQLEQEIPA